MRIVGGIHRGKRLNSPTGGAVRPTTDRVREAIFNALAHNQPQLPEGARVLDLFAGTGAFGLEALSRGAHHVTFVDNAAASLRLVRENVHQLDLAAQCTVVKADATHLPIATSTVGLVFADPPYNQGLLGPALESARARGWIDDQTVILAETSTRETPNFSSEFVQQSDRRYGETLILRISLAP